MDRVAQLYQSFTQSGCRETEFIKFELLPSVLFFCSNEIEKKSDNTSFTLIQILFPYIGNQLFPFQVFFNKKLIFSNFIFIIKERRNKICENVEAVFYRYFSKTRK